MHFFLAGARGKAPSSLLASPPAAWFSSTMRSARHGGMVSATTSTTNKQGTGSNKNIFQRLCPSPFRATLPSVCACLKGKHTAHGWRLTASKLFEIDLALTKTMACVAAGGGAVVQEAGIGGGVQAVIVLHTHRRIHTMAVGGSDNDNNRTSTTMNIVQRISFSGVHACLLVASQAPATAAHHQQA